MPMTEDNPDKPEETPSTEPIDPPEGSAAADNGDGLLIEVDASDSPAAKLAAADAKVATLTQEKKDLWDKFVRAAADLENFRKRTKRDLDDARHDSKTRVLKEMLPVVDNLERAVQHAGGGEGAAVLEGVKLVLRQFMQAFERLDVKLVEADGKPFDPNLHEAIGQQESDLAPGTVVTVLQSGYKLGDKLLRPSLVVVAKAKAAAAPSPSPSDDTAAAAAAPPETTDTSEVPDGGNS
jgi:molecular chaperone GrpE